MFKGQGLELWKCIVSTARKSRVRGVISDVQYGGYKLDNNKNILTYS